MCTVVLSIFFCLFLCFLSAVGIAVLRQQLRIQNANVYYRNGSEPEMLGVGN